MSALYPRNKRFILRKKALDLIRLVGWVSLVMAVTAVIDGDRDLTVTGVLGAVIAVALSVLAVGAFAMADDRDFGPVRRSRKGSQSDRSKASHLD